MGCFHIDAVIRNIAHRGREEAVPRLLVDTGSERTRVPGEVLERLGVTREKKDLVFMMANGQQITRSVGYAIIEVTPGYHTVDEVVFAEPGDLSLLGARTLEGLGVRVDPEQKKLVAAGPSPAAGNILTRDSQNT